MDAHIFYSILPHRCQVSVGAIAAHITTTRYTSVYLTYTFVLPPARKNRRYMKQRRKAEGAKAELRENFAKDKLQTKGLHDGKLQKRD
jgi:hypothetical protein